MTKHLAHIEELKPLVDLSDTAESAWLEIAAKPILWLGTALLALPWLLYRIRATGGAERWAWVYLGLGVVAFLPLAVHQIRWTFYPEILLLIPYAAFAGSVVDRLARGLPEVMVGLLRPLLMALLCVWPFMPTAAVQEEPRTGSGVSNAVSCPIRDLAPLLNDPAGLGAQPKTVLALIDFGPELLYRTRHSVLSIPNHRYQPGFATSYRIMSASDFAQAERALKTARIDLILICPGSAESWFYDTERSARTLNEALRDGGVPPFLRPLVLPAPLSEHFKLFRVRAAND